MLVLLDSADCPVATSARPWDRLMARVRASRLDGDLAGDASPDSTVALSLRAQMLVSERNRRDVAEGARRLLATATQAPTGDRSPEPAAHGSQMPAGHGPQMTAAGRPRVPLCRDRVREAAEELGDLIRRLLADGPVAARGVALASALLRDGSGPLYHRANADDVRARVREAVTALDSLTG
jgi:hypothetical protein